MKKTTEIKNIHRASYLFQSYEKEPIPLVAHCPDLFMFV